MLQKALPRLGQASLNLRIQFGLEGVESGLDFLGCPALLIDLGYPALNVYAGFKSAKHLVAGTENAVEQAELFAEQLEDPLVSLVTAVEEIDDHDVVFLAVAVAAADALLDALRIPRQIVVDDK